MAFSNISYYGRKKKNRHFSNTIAPFCPSASDFAAASLLVFPTCASLALLLLLPQPHPGCFPVLASPAPDAGESHRRPSPMVDSFPTKRKQTTRPPFPPEQPDSVPIHGWSPSAGPLRTPSDPQYLGAADFVPATAKHDGAGR